MDTVGVWRRSATGNCEWRTCPRSLWCGQSGIRTRDPLDERRRITNESPHPTIPCTLF